MSMKWIGAILIISACGGFGLSIAAAHRAQEQMLSKLIGVLDFMECELQYRLTPLPELCRQASKETNGFLRNVFYELACEMESQIAPDVSSCMTAVLSRYKNQPKLTVDALHTLGSLLGRFDLPGQLNGLEQVRQSCRSKLESLSRDRDVRLRSYQTLGLCAGAALAILLI